MGLLRIFLALSVVAEHAGPLFGYRFVGGIVAVEVFFIISGFYMTMILNTKYIGKSSYSLFLTNRFLRLFPLFWIVIMMVLVSSAVMGLLFDDWMRLAPYVEHHDLYDVSTLTYLMVTNILIYGQDLAMFMGIDIHSGALSFTSDFSGTSPRLHSFLLVPQAWSLGIELLFYAIAPVIVRRGLSTIMVLIALSLLLRGYIYLGLGWVHDPWIYRFFPTELALFLFGTVAFHLYGKLKDEPRLLHYQGPVIAVYLVMMIGFEYIPIHGQIKGWSLYLVSIVAIPYLFHLTRGMRMDSLIGDLSYPVYIVHVFVITVFVSMGLDSQLSLMTMIVSIVIAMVLVRYIDAPIERLRQRRVRTTASLHQNGGITVTEVLYGSLHSQHNGTKKGRGGDHCP